MGPPRPELTRLRRVRWKSNRELRTFAGPADGFDLAAMRLHHGFDQTEPKPQALLRTAFVAAKESFPDSGNFLRRNSNARVFHGEHNLMVVLSGPNFHAATR